METHPNIDATGLFDTRYTAFLTSVAKIRPRLHRYCARMTGSVMDGEDVVQESLFEAYQKLEMFDNSRLLDPWLFRLAHNRCIDFLRRRRIRQSTEAAVAEPNSIMPSEPDSIGVDRAIERLVVHLPPKERACVLLKDVFDYSLEEIANLVGSTVGGVKAALNRGRSKLAALPTQVRGSRAVDPNLSRLLCLYVERFNRQDWDGVRELISADANLRVANYFAGRFADAPYLTTYAGLTVPWRMAVGQVDGEPTVIMLRRSGNKWTPVSVIHLDVVGEHIERIRDYAECPWLLAAASAGVECRLD